MIKVPRDADPPPILLERGVAEQEKAHQARLDHKRRVQDALAAGQDPPAWTRPPFEAYRDTQVKELLIRLFGDKCAYCESMYSSTQPMDVEHYRPKGRVAENKDHPGYYWLAATWENLLPSCIDCNRRRGQEDVVLGESVKLGKQDRFPVAARHADDPGDPLEGEQALLINPVEDDPEQLLRFDADLAVVLPRADDGPDHDRASQSIDVYGLNRSGLVADRLHVLRLIDHHLEVIRLLADLRDRMTTPQTRPLVALVEEIITLELRAIFDLREPSRPYAGLARQVIAELAPIDE